MRLERPSDIFDREWEWAQLVRVVADDAPGATLGFVSGRRRQGKTFLLEGITEAAPGFYVAAIDELPAAEAPRQFGGAVSDDLVTPGTLTFESWEQALGALLGLAQDSALPVILDEFPYLACRSPELPSVIQTAFSPRGAACWVSS